MELSLNRNDPLNTVLSTSDGRPMYSVYTPSKILGTANTAITNVSGSRRVIGFIEWHSWSDANIRVHNHTVAHRKGGVFSR